MSAANSVTPPAPALAQEEWRSPVNPWLIAIAVMSATFMEVLDTTIVNVSLPHIAGNMSASNEEATWVLTSYLVSNAIVLPATGWLSSYFGRKRFLITCIVLFTLASALCGAAGSLGMLIVARVLQGFAGGALQPISQAILLESFPVKKRGVAMAVFGLGIVTAPIMGPALGGWITDNYTWRWVFYINLPIGIMAVSLCAAFLRDPPYMKGAKPKQIDYWGFLLLAVWIGCFQVLLDKGQQEDWMASEFIRWLAVIAGLGFIAFVVRELKTDTPLVNLRILTNRNFLTGTVLMAVMGGVLYGSISILPLFLQTLLGYPAMQSGMVVSPRGFGSIAGMLLVGRLMGVLDNRFLIGLGFVLLAVSTFMLGSLNLDVESGSIMWPNIVNGFATALIFVPMTTFTMGTLMNEQMGNAAGIYNLMRNLGGGVGIAIVTTMLARYTQVHQASLVTHLTELNPVYQAHVGAIAGEITRQTGAEGTHAAEGIVYGQMLRQASLQGYMDVFRYMALASILCLPAVLLFRKATAKGPVSAH